MKVERYWNDKDEMAVLISPGFGAGWSTWGDHKELAYDKRIIEAFIDGASSDTIEEICEICGYGYVCTYGWSDCEIVWIPRGEPFYIDEYDGNERIIDRSNIQIAEDEE